MKRLFFTLLFFVVLTTAAILLLPSLLSADKVRDQIAQQIANSTGRDITLGGPARITVFPNVNVEIDDVALATATGLGAEPFVRMQKLSGSLELWPMLSGEFKVKHFRLVGPEINLVVGKDGTRSWDFAPIEISNISPDQAKQANAAELVQTSASTSSSIPNIKLGRVNIVDGRLNYRDLRSGLNINLNKINTDITWTSREAPLELEGSLVWNDKPINLNANFESVLALIDGASTNTQLQISSKDLVAEMDGSMNVAADLAFNGNISAQVDSVSSFADWVKRQIPLAETLANFSIRSKVVKGGSKLSFSDSLLKFGRNSAEGTVTLITNENDPRIQATLAFDTLNLNDYIGSKATGASSNSESGASQASNSSAWNTKRFKLDGLRGVNADVRLSANDIILQDYDLGSGAISIALKDGNLATKIVGLQAYQGTINGNINIDARRETASHTIQMKTDNINIGQLITKFNGSSRLTGLGSVNINTTSVGNNEKQIIENLDGTASIDAKNGSISGLDVAQIIEAFQTRNLATLGQITIQQNQKTNFDSFKANYQINKGIAQNSDLLLTSNAINLSGVGAVNLPQQTVDYKFKVSALRQGETNSDQNSKLLDIPFIVKGPWNSPKLTLDAAALITGSETIQNTVNNVTDALQRGDIDSARDAIENAPKDLIEQGKELFDGDSNAVKSILDQVIGPAID